MAATIYSTYNEVYGAMYRIQMFKPVPPPSKPVIRRDAAYYAKLEKVCPTKEVAC